MNSMLSRDGRRDVIKMAVVIGSGEPRRSLRPTAGHHHGNVAKHSLGKRLRDTAAVHDLKK